MIDEDFSPEGALMLEIRRGRAVYKEGHVLAAKASMPAMVVFEDELMTADQADEISDAYHRLAANARKFNRGTRRVRDTLEWRRPAGGTWVLTARDERGHPAVRAEVAPTHGDRRVSLTLLGSQQWLDLSEQAFGQLLQALDQQLRYMQVLNRLYFGDR